MKGFFMAEYVKQHYVPQFYLKNFSKNKNNINCLDKIQLKTYSSNIKNIAQEKKFYETSNINIEHDLANIEKNAKKDIDLLLQNKKYNLLKNQKYKFRLAFYTYIQLMRTKFVREDMYNSLMSLKEHIENKYGLDDNLENCFNTILDELEIKESHLEFIMDFDMDIFRLIFTKKWIFLDNKTELNFWTSDNPVVLCNKQGNLGLDIDHIHIFFPLSPKYCL